jgi:hypothetical protein
MEGSLEGQSESLLHYCSADLDLFYMLASPDEIIFSGRNVRDVRKSFAWILRGSKLKRGRQSRDPEEYRLEMIS